MFLVAVKLLKSGCERNGMVIKTDFYGDESAFFLRQFVQTIINSVDRFWNDG